MAFVQNKRVKVSLFLQEGLQASDGRFHLPRPAAEGSGRKAAPLGTCRFFDANGHVVDERRFKVGIGAAGVGSWELGLLWMS